VILSEQDNKSRASEWRSHWRMVVVAMMGVSLGTIPSATLGMFMDPLHEQFGWSRTQISAGLTVFALASLPLTPVAGVLVDRYGARRVVLPGLAVSGVVFASFGLLTGSIMHWFTVWLVYTLASLAIRTLVWNTAISSAFNASRGLAIAVLLCGTALAQSLSPLAAGWLIDSIGWRGAYVGLGLGWGGIVLALNLMFFKDRFSPSNTEECQGSVATVPLPGLTVRAALHSPVLYRIALAIFLQSTMAVAVMVHLVPILAEHGLSRVEAGSIATLLGVAAIAGKLLTGWLVDRTGTSLLRVICFGLPVLAYLILRDQHSPIWLLALAVGILGYCSGSCLQLATYLTSRYCGLRNFGTIFGFISTLLALSAGIGPLFAGVIFDRLGSYEVVFLVGCGAAFIASAAMIALGPYPDFTKTQ
jgi:MFS family permease